MKTERRNPHIELSCANMHAILKAFTEFVVLLGHKAQ